MEYRKLKLVLNFIKVVIVLLAAALTAFILTKTNLTGTEWSDLSGKEEDKIKELVKEEAGYGLQLAYITGAICAGAAILFSIYQVIVNFKRSVPALVGVLLFAIVLFISYGMASAEVPMAVKENLGITDSQYQLFGGGVISIYVFLGLAVLAIVASEVRRIIIGSKA